MGLNKHRQNYLERTGDYKVWFGLLKAWLKFSSIRILDTIVRLIKLGLGAIGTSARLVELGLGIYIW